ncbi:MAG: phosphotransferase family protein [Ilumatobacter sp.]|nr:phosphotransferase family protein [Ilumatobacter sp.]
MDGSADDLAGALALELADALGPVDVEDLQRLTAGANRETWRFDAHCDGVVHPLIVQLDRAGLADGGSAHDARILAVAAGHGACVPEVVVAGDGATAVGRSFLVTRRLDGETIPRRLLRDERWTAARATFVDDCAAALAKIHAIPIDVPELAGVPRVADPLAPLREMYDPLDDPHPAFELGLRWLDLHRPAPLRPAVVHGDFRLGNLLLDERGLAAVLDWELAMIGDPTADLGWLCVRAWRFGAPGRVAGIGAAEDLLSAYNARAGTTIDVDALRWWELWGTVRWGIMCLFMGGGFRRGLTSSIELAMVGRRVVENAADVVDLLRELEADR